MILSVIGTRPEAIKMAPLILEMGRRGIAQRVCVTAQHRQLLDQVLELFGIVPDVDLNLMRPGQDLYDVTASALTGLRDVIAKVKPRCVLVHGDTTTSFAASLASYYQRIQVGHVEAGLRTGNLLAPWPEEGNRRLTAVLTRWHFAPTAGAQASLIREGVPPGHITVTGNTVIDALQEMVRRLDDDSKLSAQLASQFPFLDNAQKLILITGHRRENFGDGMSRVCTAIDRLSRRGDVQLVYPLHPNPNITGPVKSRLSGLENVHLIDPLEYLPFVYMMRRAHLILTDSGGVQEEAPSLGKPVLVMRDTTERPEAVAAGSVILVGTDDQRIVSEVNRLLDDPSAYSRMSKVRNPYGDGKACARILEVLSQI
jgi:UDP-N-acetylglucosamine 2-epimerase (non-hydrolysing)